MQRREIKNGIVLRICCGFSCGEHAEALHRAACRTIDDRNLGQEVGLDEQSCYGKCFAGPNILVERWRDGQRNESALLAIMLGRPHDDLVYEEGVIVDDIPNLIRRHHAAWRRSLEKDDHDS